MQFPPQWWPDQPTLDSYQKLLDPQNSVGQDFLRFFWNSLFVSTATTILSVIVAVPAAYAFSRFTFPGRNFLFFAVLLRNMFPAVIFLVPLFILMRAIGLVNTHAAYHLVSALAGEKDRGRAPLLIRKLPLAERPNAISQGSRPTSPVASLRSNRSCADADSLSQVVLPIIKASYWLEGLATEFRAFFPKPYSLPLADLVPWSPGFSTCLAFLLQALRLFGGAG